MANTILTNVTNTVSINSDDKKTAHEKSNCLIHLMSLIVVCLLLVVSSIACYYYYTRHQLNKESALAHYCIDIKSNEQSKSNVSKNIRTIFPMT